MRGINTTYFAPCYLNTQFSYIHITITSLIHVSVWYIHHLHGESHTTGTLVQVIPVITQYKPTKCTFPELIYEILIFLFVFHMFRTRGFIFRKAVVYTVWYGTVCFTGISMNPTGSKHVDDIKKIKG